MRRSDTWRAAALAAMLVMTAAGGAAAQEPDGTEAAARTSDLVFRSVDLRYRSTSLDGTSSVTETGDEKAVTLAADVLFAFDRADLTTEAQEQLAAVADELADLGPRTVTIGGHTDDVGDDAYNQTLSTERAQAVHAHLAAALGGGYTFEVTGHGESQPVAPNRHEDGSDDPEGRAANRRVVITYATD